MAHPATHSPHNAYPATPFIDSITLPYCTYNVTFPAGVDVSLDKVTLWYYNSPTDFRVLLWIIPKTHRAAHPPG
jgi:hypothetical protein